MGILIGSMFRVENWSYPPPHPYPYPIPSWGLKHPLTIGFHGDSCQKCAINKGFQNTTCDPLRNLVGTFFVQVPSYFLMLIRWCSSCCLDGAWCCCVVMFFVQVSSIFPSINSPIGKCHMDAQPFLF